MSAAIKPGDIKGGYRFTGGDPKDYKNWEPAHPVTRTQAPQIDLFGRESASRSAAP